MKSLFQLRKEQDEKLKAEIEAMSLEDMPGLSDDPDAYAQALAEMQERARKEAQSPIL